MEAIEVDPARHAPGVPGFRIVPGFLCSVDQRGDFLPEGIVDSESHPARRGELIPDRGARIERVRIGLHECELAGNAFPEAHGVLTWKRRWKLRDRRVDTNLPRCHRST